MLQQLFLPFEVDQMSHLPLLRLNGDDRLVWNAMVDGFFTVKSAYRCIKDWQRRDMVGSSSVGSSLVWKYLRKLNILPRQAHFIWRILCKAVPTWQRLWNWGVACPLWCPRCDGVVECLEHLM